MLHAVHSVYLLRPFAAFGKYRPLHCLDFVLGLAPRTCARDCRSIVGTALSLTFLYVARLSRLRLRPRRADRRATFATSSSSPATRAGSVLAFVMGDEGKVRRK